MLKFEYNLIPKEMKKILTITSVLMFLCAIALPTMAEIRQKTKKRQKPLKQPRLKNLQIKSQIKSVQEAEVVVPIKIKQPLKSDFIFVIS